jgi:hypothetical protein
LVICLCSHIVYGQKKHGNYLDFQNKQYYFGITLAYNNSSYKIYNSKSFILNDSIRYLAGGRGPGANIGIITNLKIGSYFDLRFLPTLSFAERNVNYKLVNDVSAPYDRKVNSVFLELPFHIRYHSDVYKDKKFFIIAGVKYSYDVASDSRSRESNSIIKIAPTDFAFEIGGGIQMYFPYFIFSPEIKFSHGLTNILLYDNNLIQSKVIDKLLSRGLTISFHFEG